ncbi:hypothetical protein R5H30_16650 [Sulfitobacter sp. D35]|uniref:hypothetical protein n=1 Tax=Sulfitobacter sp. D35 TaxID=3083252 RepID=UPI00296F1F26|nr:hypothetical protein [Sulfitobacter sp. D35]MDW4499625.1 hypothetical protein [Sulfitobacter sp. D35]
MRSALALALACLSSAALACEDAVCVVDPDALALTRIITFEETQSASGPGRLIDDLLVLDGASFGERFAGQALEPRGNHDSVTGDALRPLTLMTGEKGRNLSIVFMSGENVLNGYGPAGFPKRDGQGEGAIAVLFDDDQSELSFQIRGGEAGYAHALFLRRDGSIIAGITLQETGESAIGFARAGGKSDIAGIVITNEDPQGLAIDNLRFGRAPDLS